MRFLLAKLLPHQMNGTHPIRSSIGAGLAIGLSLVVGLWIAHRTGLSPALIAPIGASAVLVFAVPASPLAQPRAVLGKSGLGDRRGAAVKNGAIAICHGRYGCWAGDHDDALVALPASSRGAVALSVAIGAQSGAWPWSFLLFPVGVNSLTLLVIGWLFNNMTGSRYPHRHEILHKNSTPIAYEYDRRDLEAALDKCVDRPDISIEDLDEIIRSILIRRK
jgi:CBS domain-containing membrane protein